MNAVSTAVHQKRSAAFCSRITMQTRLESYGAPLQTPLLCAKQKGSQDRPNGADTQKPDSRNSNAFQLATK